MSSLERECALSIWRVRIVEGYDLGIWVVPRIIFVPCMESLCMGRFLFCAKNEAVQSGTKALVRELAHGLTGLCRIIGRSTRPRWNEASSLAK